MSALLFPGLNSRKLDMKAPYPSLTQRQMISISTTIKFYEGYLKVRTSIYPCEGDDRIVNPVIKQVVLDVLKPIEPRLPDFASKLCALEGINRVDVSLVEMNVQTMSLKVVIEGSAIDFESLEERMGEIGAVIHSVDQVIVEEE